MTIIIKNKETLLFDDFRFRCSVGKKGFSKNKKEGDFATPKGIFRLGDIFYRADRIKKPQTKLKTFIIKKNMGWCDDPKSKFYNRLIRIRKKSKLSYEKLFRKDYKYDLLVLIKYNYERVVKNSGSAIFLHLTKKYSSTEGCIAMKKKDLLILLKVINKKTNIEIR
tara:strand:+ start:482 stop:979 length:498 start_codon:yes stop_codon:yes gene_type:complete